MLLTMPQVVLEVVAFGFEGVVAFIFDFPAGAASRDNRRDRGVRNQVTRHKGIVIQAGAVEFVGDREFAPIDAQRIFTGPERNVIHLAIGPDFTEAAVPLAMRHTVDTAGGG